MFKTRLFFYFLIAITIRGCDNKKKALAFNDKIAHLNNRLSEKGAAIGPILKSALSTHNFSKLKKPCNDIIEMVKNDIEELNKLENVAGSEDLKSAALYYFNFENNIIEKCFAPFTVMNEKTPDSEIEIAIDNLKQGIKDEAPVLERLKRLQHKYALKNGFIIASDN